MPSAFNTLTLQMLAHGYSLDIFYRHLSILCKGASHPENVTVYRAADKPGPEDSQEALAIENTV